MGFLDDWKRKQHLKQTEHNNAIAQANITLTQYGLVAQQRIKEQELYLVRQMADLRHHISNNNLDIALRVEGLNKTRQEIARSNAEFRLYLDKQYQDLTLQKEAFYFEQDQANKQLDYAHTSKMTELHLRQMEMEHNHFLRLTELELQREEVLFQRAIVEENKIEKQLEQEREEKRAERAFQHEETIQNLEQQRADKALDYEHLLQKSNQTLQQVNMGQKHIERLAEIEVQREALANEREAMQQQRIVAEENRTEKMLAMMKEEYRQSKVFNQEEKMQQMKMDIKKYEYEIAKIGLLKPLVREQELHKIQLEMEERMKSFHTKSPSEEEFKD